MTTDANHAALMAHRCLDSPPRYARIARERKGSWDRGNLAAAVEKSERERVTIGAS
jgi:hypothetical protein